MNQLLEYRDESGNLFSEVNEENFMLFAVRNYKNPVCSGIEEFYEDVDKIKYIKRQLTRYYMTDEINERLFLNNVIVFFNVFDLEAAKIMLLHKIEQEFWGSLKSAMIFLGYMRDDELSDIPEDIELTQKLERL